MDITALVIAAVASFAISIVWYTVLFGKTWRRLVGLEDRKSGMGRTLALGFLLDIVRAYVMLNIVAAMGAYSVGTGIEAGFWAWLGLVFTVLAGQWLYAKRPWKLVAIDSAYYLVSLMVMGGILAVW